MTPKKIFVNGRFLTQELTGIQKFALGVCQELHCIGHDIIFICPKKGVYSPSFGTIIHTGLFSGHAWEQFDLPKHVKTNKIETLLNLSNSAPLALNNNIVTVHDLAFLKNPDWFSLSYRIFYSYLTPRIIKKAKTVFTVSHTSKKEILETFSVADSKVKVLRQGVFYSESPDNPAPNRFGKYFLYVGSLDPRKRISFLIDAFKKTNLTEYRLILVGRKNPIFEQQEFNLPSNIVLKSSVNDAELQTLYKNAVATILPSQYEGFGRPILESLYFGTEVICSDLPVFRENFNSFVHFFETNSTASLTQQLIKNTHLDRKVLAVNLPQNFFSFTFAAKVLIKSL
jgi:glycosyltransferase involved in cell wall biosynthesis